MSSWPGVERPDDADAKDLVREAEAITYREVYKRWLEQTTGLRVVDHRDWRERR